MVIDLDEVGGAPGAVWRAPSGADIVACALFSCPPSFTRIGESPTGAELKKISNFEQCVMLFHTAPADQSEFALVDENRCAEPEGCQPASPGPPLVTGLAVGCWAYDTTSIVAASDLVHVPGTMVSELAAIPHDSACSHDGDGCYDEVHDRFGVCLGRTCRPPCVSPVDCAMAGEPAPSSQPCGWSCVGAREGALGACVPGP